MHIKAVVEGKKVGRILIDRGTTINLLPFRILDKLGKAIEELRSTNTVVTDYRGKSTPVEGVVLLNVKVRAVEHPTLLVVILLKSSYNLLLGRDWIHGVVVVLSTAHQKLILWNVRGELEVVEADDHPCYM